MATAYRFVGMKKLCLINGTFRRLLARPVGQWQRVIALCAVMLTTPSAFAAAPASFVATADQPLRFGTLVTAGGGSRTIGADGSTSNNGVFALGEQAAGPAQFTMTYARASGDTGVYQLIFQVTMPAVPPVSAGGVQGNVSEFTTDLPGVPVLRPGQTAVTTLPACATPTCQVTFHVGGTLTIVRGGGGAALTFPLFLLTSVTAALG